MRLPRRLIGGSLRPDRHSLARFASLRWAALPIVDRRWTAPMSAIALGFGLFVGVAIGPGTEGTQGTTGPMVIRVPAPQSPQTALAPPDASGGAGQKPAGPSRPGGGNPGGGAGGGAALPGGSPPVFDAPSLTPSITTPPATDAIGGTTSTTTTDDSADGGSTTEPAETELTGTVVHLNPAAASYAIAAEDGSLRAIHSHKAPSVGREVEVEATALVNGTYAETGKRRERGTRGRVGFDGTVSFRDPRTGIYTVSAPGVSLLVRGGAQRTPPEVGDQVEVEARIAGNPEPLEPDTAAEQGCGKPPAPPPAPRASLEQVGLELAEGEPASSLVIEAIVQGVCRSSRELLVSADDVSESGRAISLSLAESAKLAKLKKGQVLKLGAEIGDGAALTVTTIAGDEGRKGAEDPDLVQPRELAGAGGG